MSAGSKDLPRVTAADLLAVPEEERFHEGGGELVRKTRPSRPHGLGQSQVVSQVGGL